MPKYRVYLTLSKGDWIEVGAIDPEVAIDKAIADSRKAHGHSFEYECDDYEELPTGGSQDGDE